MYSLEDTHEVMRWYREFLPAQPDELGGFVSMMSVPPGPPFPEELHLRKVCAIVWTQAGDEESAALREARSFGTPLLDGVAPMPLPVWNTAFDAMLPAGEQWYWRGEFFDALPDAAIDQHAAFGAELPTWKSLMHFYPVDGAAARVGNDETAWGYRDATWSQVIAGVAPDVEDAGAITDWTKAYSDSLKPYAMGGGYSNFEMDEPSRVHGMYGANYDRLAKIKAHYDPENVFQVNQNIKPA
jgi:FAD/FMN-containing dehydrogenase